MRSGDSEIEKDEEKKSEKDLKEVSTIWVCYKSRFDGLKASP